MVILLFMFSTLLLLLKHPQVLNYMFVHMTYEKMGYISSLGTILSSFNIFSHQTLWSFFLVLMTLLSFLFLFVKRSGLFFVTSFGFFVSLLQHINLLKAKPIDLGFNYYEATFLLFFMICSFVIFFTLRTWEKRRIFFLVLLFIFLPFIGHFYYETQFVKAKMISEQGIAFFSDLNGTLLVENIPDPIALNKHFPTLHMDNKNVTAIHKPYFNWDGWYSPKLVEKGFAEQPIDFLEKRLIQPDQLLEIQQQMEQNKYDMVIVSPVGTVNIYQAFTNLIANGTNPYCIVQAPFFTEEDGYVLNSRNHVLNLLFTNTSLCTQETMNLFSYYAVHYQDFCSIGVDVAEVVKKNLLTNFEIYQVPDQIKQMVTELDCPKRYTGLNLKYREMLSLNWAN
jgi:hypothetical protein